MKKLVLIGFFIVLIIHSSNCIELDNRLVSAQNDCFERIALGAMMPFEKTFRNSDTNSLRACENICMMDKKCKTFSFGISARGNGTCQLSADLIDVSNTRQSGTVFDPDFDLYARKPDCLNQIPQPGGFSNEGPNDRPLGFLPPNTDNPPPTIFIPTTITDNGYPTTIITDPHSSYPSSHEHPSTLPGNTIDHTRPRPTSEEELYSSRDPSTVYTTTNRYPSTERYPGGVSGQNGPNNNQNRPPYSNGPNPNAPGQNDKRIPIEELYPDNVRYPSPTPSDRNPSSSRPNRHPSSPGGTAETYPPQGSWDQNKDNVYRYPMLYEKNYPMPNDPTTTRFPNGYAQNIPSVFVPYSKPSGASEGNSRPPYDNRPSYGGSNDVRPGYGDNNDMRPGTSSRPVCRTCENRPGYGDRNSNDRVGYGGNQGNSISSHSSGGNKYGDRDVVPMNKPSSYGGGVSSPTFGGNKYPERDQTQYGQSNGGGSAGGYQVTERPQDTHKNQPERPCFRRVLAGKRVAAHWVRRTLICERVEECQRECGEEKRFSCEGFNYRLDNTGRGQGDCELVDVPLTHLDLYSSPHSRDENLIRHPDYDYYERDRSASPSCRQTPACSECPQKPYRPAIGPSPSDGYNRPIAHRLAPPSSYGHEKPEIYMPTSIDKYRPPVYEHRPNPIPPPPSSSYFGGGSSVSQHHYSHGSFEHGGSIDRYGSEESDHYRPTYHHKPEYVEEPAAPYGPPPKPYVDSHHDSHKPSSNNYYPRPDDYRPSKPSYGGDSHFDIKPSRPDSYDHGNHGYLPRPDSYPVARPESYPVARPESYPISRPESYPISRPENYPISRPESYPISRPESYPISRPENYPVARPQYQYSDRDRPSYSRPTSNFIPYLIGSHESSNSWGQYGGTYGSSSSSHSYKPQSDYWGLTSNDNGYNNRRKDPQNFNYNEISGGTGLVVGSGYRPAYEENSVYPPTRYGSGGGGGGGGGKISHNHYQSQGQEGHRNEFGTQWTRRPGVDECSVKSSEGFRLHKGVVRHAMSVPSVIECERMCFGETRFRCHTFSYRYSSVSRDNCLLCDKQYNLLDFYADLEPDRDFDIYSMSDEQKTCSKNSQHNEPKANTQCFFRAIDGSRFFKSIIRESISARSIGECELECIKSSKFTCRAFSFRIDSAVSSSAAGNCELSDWPVRDMDKERHLLVDKPFDIFERASYGQGCEVQPIVDDKHNKKFCYLGYGSSAKLLSSAIKKVISVPNETECKNECIRFRESSTFKCLSFSFGSQASTFNCEMSDLDQTELKLDVHYSHTNDRDYWLFAWNPFDFTCRDKVTTIGSAGGNRVNNERRMDIFREPGDGTWQQFTVSGKACRVGTKCEKNLITGFYSCELEGGEIGAWDYCCKNDHPCGHSRDFDYPWCFVGDTPDQWRTCSEKYFPTKSPISSSSSGGVTRFPNRKKGEIYQSPPRPGGLQHDVVPSAAKLWPVTFLHSEGPPNSTDISNVIDCKKDKC